MNETLKRKLVAIFYADVTGYSRLTGDDEEGTHRRVMVLLDHAGSTIEDMGGTVLRFAGDAILAEFASVVVAVNAAVQIQTDLAARNKAIPDKKKVEIRVGVSLGDVIQDRGEVFGDGVNLAARLEAHAAPGGVCISAVVYDQIEGKVESIFTDGGDQDFKNIARPVRVYQWTPGGMAEKTSKSPSSGRAGSRKPSIAVLPLNDLSGSQDQHHFCDGITEDIITALSKARGFTVTARNSTFAYKGRSPDVRKVARELEVDYVLEGSVRKSGSKLRIAAQLIDGLTGDHVWADTFDRAVDDEFETQDEVTQRITSNLVERIWQYAAKNLGQKPVEDYDALDYATRGLPLIHQIDPEAIDHAMVYLQKAVELDEQLPLAHLGLGFCNLITWLFWDDPSRGAADKAWQHALKMQELAPDDANTYRLLSRVNTARRRYDEASECVERALKMNPHDGDIIGNKGVFLMFLGRWGEALAWFDKVLQLHADTPHTVDIMYYWKALTQFMSADYGTAAATLRSINGLDYIKSILLGASYAMLGDEREAAVMSSSVLKLRPLLTVSDIELAECFYTKDHGQTLRNALRLSGLPE